jgi:uncharacterized membrane protein YeaQ/YmgE (transglycosylase-associated protein family)
MKSRSILRHLSVSAIFVLQLNLALLSVSLRAAEEPGVVDRTKAVVEDTKTKVKDATLAVEGAAKEVKDSVQDASRAVGSSFENLWRRVSDSRLQKRTRDEIVAWAIMGVLVGAVAGMMTTLKTSGLGKVGRLMLGLAGAFVGGMIVHVGRIDFGLGPVLIRYEELLFSLVGAVLLVIVARLFRSGAKKKSSGK